MSEPEVTTTPDGTVTIMAEVELPAEDDEPTAPAASPSDPVASVLSGLVHATGKLLGGIWDAIRPDDSAPCKESEEE